MDRVRIKIAGQSGSGLLSVGEIISSAINYLGYNIVTDREYPSLIKGGHSCFTINVSDKPIFSLSEGADVLVAIDKISMNAYLETLSKGGVLIHGGEDFAKDGINIARMNTKEVALASGGTAIMQNMVLTGMVWKVLGFDFEKIEKEVKTRFKKVTKEILDANIECVKRGYEGVETAQGIWNFEAKKTDNVLIDGSRAVALGAVACGVRAYYGYPMSPSSGILTYLAEINGKTDMIVKQAEDEITASQMALGSMYMGTRALVATSGGGYDLMTETVSLAGIMENPLVILIGQRPGPGTGLPTWTAQGDLDLAIHSSHGEFPRVVIGLSDIEDSFELVGEAFNFTEKYQTPVILLSEKTILESKISVDRKFFDREIKIERGLTEGKNHEEPKRGDRYKLTDSGISPRWIPGDGNEYYFANGDEHFENGDDTEKAEEIHLIYEKRMKKMVAIKENLPAPEIFGVEKNADISFVGWGSSKNAMRDVIETYAEKGVKVNYLHYSFVWPLQENAVKDFFKNNKNVNLIEGNYLGQFGNIVESQTGVKFKNRLLKFDGRAFFIEDIIKFIDKNGI
ncbi:2-oxoacid:acceptor oxidoreductase subunit alpha [Candidatus Gracilibacteria bacterium]|nr:2-oxoacid:acceptor oxidoreductase subunit alpha [Candidatus Gracilibacteria bacterium]